MGQLGRYFIFLYNMFTNRENFGVYVKMVVNECYQIGVNSVFIFVLVSSFMGAVTVVQTAHNLISPLIPDYVIALVTRDMAILEMSPTIMAIVFAGKVGSNISSELGTMRISEQIDAIEVMGINATSYLVLPKVIASLIVYPLLVILSAGLLLLGGYFAGIMTGVITPHEYAYGLRADFIPFNVSFALIKSFAFAFLVSSISAFWGFHTRGGALEVGIASTGAVTSSCIAILIADYLLAQLLLVF
ncbi:ABC transporter permease [Hyphobacterium sp. CCMP332]|nr:ABC transporter permease [Hyphobacterium sp. CCMP332]